MTQKDSTLIRITRKLKGDLEELGRLWTARYFKGDMTVPAPDDKGNMPMERIIRTLLDRDQQHRMRSKRSIESTRPVEANPDLNGSESSQ